MLRAASMFILASVVAVASEPTPTPVPSTYAPTPVPSTYAPTPVPSTYAPTPVPSTYAPTPVPSTYAPTPVPSNYHDEEYEHFQAPESAHQSYHEPYQCTSTAKPNSGKYMSYVCSSLYASALKWSRNNCKGYYAATNASDPNSLYQARLCTYWTEKSVFKVVSSCFIEAHLRTEFIQKHGKEGPGVWFCKYQEFVDQVMDCYGGSLKYYPLGETLNSLEASVTGLTPKNTGDMPPLQYTGASVAMCAYYNKDQVYHRGDH